MNKQLVQKLIKDYNDYLKDNMIYIIIESNGITYNCYNNINYGDKGINFMDEDKNLVILEYKYIVGVKIRVI